MKLDILNQHIVDFEVEKSNSLGKTLVEIVEDFKSYNSTKDFIVHQVINRGKEDEFTVVLYEVELKL